MRLYFFLLLFCLGFSQSTNRATYRNSFVLETSFREFDIVCKVNTNVNIYSKYTNNNFQKTSIYELSQVLTVYEFFSRDYKMPNMPLNYIRTNGSSLTSIIIKPEWISNYLYSDSLEKSEKLRLFLFPESIMQKVQQKIEQTQQINQESNTPEIVH